MPKPRVPPKGERLAHIASERFRHDGRVYADAEDLWSSDDDDARRRRRRRARQAKAKAAAGGGGGGEGSGSGDSGDDDDDDAGDGGGRRRSGRGAPPRAQAQNGGIAEQLTRLCTLPSPGAAKLVADLNTSIPTASEIYESLEKQATALKADATHVITRALSISGLSTDTGGKSPTHQGQRVLPPLPPALPPVRRAPLPPNSLRLPARGDGTYAPRTPLTPVAEISLRVKEDAPPEWAVLERERLEQEEEEEDESEYSDDGSGSGSGSGGSDVSYDEESVMPTSQTRGAAPAAATRTTRSAQRVGSGLHAMPPAAATPRGPPRRHASGAGMSSFSRGTANGHRPAAVRTGPPAAAAAAAADDDDDSEGHSPGRDAMTPLSRRMLPPPTRGASALRYARSLSARAAAALRSSARSGARSPYTQGVKRVLTADMVRAALGALLMDALFGVLGTMLSVFVPQVCPPTGRVVVTPQLVIPASGAAHLCTIVEQIAYPRMSALHKAVFLTNCVTLVALLACELVCVWRELNLIDLCDEDRSAEWTNLTAQLSAFPALGDRLDALNGSAHVAAGGMLALLVANWGVTAVLALRDQFADYRTPVVLVALAAPSVRRMASFFHTAGESKRKRLALPLWAWGLVSLNCLDERHMRTGEDSGARRRRTSQGVAGPRK